MRVCFVLPGRAAAPTGGYAVAYRYAAELSRQGHDVTVLHGRTKKPGDGWKAQLAPLVYKLSAHERPRWFATPPALRVHNVAPLRADSIPPSDVIIATGVMTAEPVARACERSGARGVYLIQHFEDFVTTADEVRGTWRLPMTRVVVSDWLRALVEAEGLSCTVIRNGIDTSVFYPRSEKSVDESMVMAMVSEVPWKRTDLVCDAFSRISDTSRDIRLVTFGTCPKPRGLPAAAVHHRKPEPPQLAGLYRQASVFLCASDSEGFGLPVAEAMASGAPVVSTDIDGIRSYAGEVPLYVRPGDSEALANAALSLIYDESAAHSRSAAGIALARTMDADAAAKAFAELCINGMS